MDTDMTTTSIAQTFSQILDMPSQLRRIRRRIAAVRRRRRQLEAMRVRDEYALAGFGLTRAELRAAVRDGRLWQMINAASGTFHPHPGHSPRRRA
jgi:uncharacterized protein YjiS (DUF1127 family)